MLARVHITSMSFMQACDLEPQSQTYQIAYVEAQAALDAFAEQVHS